MTMIFCADLHISELTFKTCPMAKYDSITSLRKIFRRAEELRAELDEVVPVVMGGDIWDSTHVTPDILARVMDVRADYSRIPLFYVDGNHDKVEPSWTSFLSNAHHLDEYIKVLPGGEKVVGADYSQVGDREAVFESLDNCADFVVGHQFVEPDGNTKIASSMPLSDLRRFKKEKTACLFGDIHVPQVINNQETELYYPGPTNRRAIKEPEGGYMVISDRDIGNCTRMSNGFWFRRETMRIRDLYFIDIEELTLASIPLVIKQIEEKECEIPPFVVLRSNRFDEEAIKELLSRTGEHCNLLFRRHGSSQVEEFESGDSAVASCAKEYAVEALRKLPVDDEVKRLGAEMILDEYNFFENLQKHFGVNVEIH